MISSPRMPSSSAAWTTSSSWKSSMHSMHTFESSEGPLSRSPHRLGNHAQPPPAATGQQSLTQHPFQPCWCTPLASAQPPLFQGSVGSDGVKSSFSRAYSSSFALQDQPLNVCMTIRRKDKSQTRRKLKPHQYRVTRG